MRPSSILTAAVAALVVAGLGGAGLAQDYTIEKGQAGPGTVPYSPYVEQTFARRVFWGDTHLHTTLWGRIFTLESNRSP